MEMRWTKMLKRSLQVYSSESSTIKSIDYAITN